MSIERYNVVKCKIILCWSNIVYLFLAPGPGSGSETLLFAAKKKLFCPYLNELKTYSIKNSWKFSILCRTKSSKSWKNPRNCLSRKNPRKVDLVSLSLQLAAAGPALLTFVTFSEKVKMRKRLEWALMRVSCYFKVSRLSLNLCMYMYTHYVFAKKKPTVKLTDQLSLRIWILGPKINR